MIESADIFRSVVFLAGGVVIGGLVITGRRCAINRAWASLLRNIASILGVAFVMASVGIRLGEALTWRTPLAAAIFTLIFLSLKLKQKGYG